MVTETVKDVRDMSDQDLAVAMRQWADAVESAPAYVKTELLQAHRTHRQLKDRYDRAVAVAKVQGPHMKAFGAEVDQAAQKVEQLQAAHDERQRWYDDTADVREAAQEARSELVRRAGHETEAAVVAQEDMTDNEARIHEIKQRQAQQAIDREQQRHQKDDGGMTMEMKY